MMETYASTQSTTSKALNTQISSLADGEERYALSQSNNSMKKVYSGSTTAAWRSRLKENNSDDVIMMSSGIGLRHKLKI